MKVTRPALEGPLILEPQLYRDDRGFLLESYRADRYARLGLGPFVQDNWSRSKQGVLRGLHFQEPNPQGKLVMVTRGAAWDVAVDVRRGSPTFGQHVAVELSETNALQLWVPPGFAHGFLALADDTDVLYKCTAAYAPDCERSLHWADPDLALPWPLPAPTVSLRDSQAPRLKDAPVLPRWDSMQSGPASAMAPRRNDG